LNEAVILFLSYLCLLFAGLVIDKELKSEIGWVYVFTLLVSIGINMSIIIYTSIIKPLYLKYLFRMKMQEAKEMSAN